MIKSNSQHTSSFRDPSGHIFISNEGIIFRKILPVYFKSYEALKQSGFYQKLIDNQLLISHEEVSNSKSEIVLKPEVIPFFSYPYEWSFLQYKLAALHTLKLQKYALSNNFSLKDASAFNITFHNGKPIFIDTLSFDLYNENEPWRAYKQFISHFFGPLLLSKYYGSGNLKVLSQHIDGMDISDIAKLLPFKSKLSPVIYSNIHLLAKFEKKYGNGSNLGEKKSIALSKKSQIKIIESLYEFIKDLKTEENSEWKNYYSQINYNEASFNFKKDLIASWISKSNGKKIIDLGGNDGTFSRVLQDNTKSFIVCDIDANAVEANMKQIIQNKENNILPIVMDLLNPSAAIGFNNEERSSFVSRVQSYQPDILLSLALIHHLTLSGNVPFFMTASFFSNLAPFLIIEFPDRKDSWVDFLLESKKDFKDHFEGYNLDNFELEYSRYFDIIEKVKIPETERTMYLLKSKLK